MELSQRMIWKRMKVILSMRQPIVTMNDYKSIEGHRCNCFTLEQIIIKTVQYGYLYLKHRLPNDERRAVYEMQ